MHIIIHTFKEKLIVFVFREQNSLSLVQALRNLHEKSWYDLSITRFISHATYNLGCSQPSCTLPLASRMHYCGIPSQSDTNIPQSGTVVAAVRLLWWHRTRSNTCTHRL